MDQGRSHLASLTRFFLNLVLHAHGVAPQYAHYKIAR